MAWFFGNKQQKYIDNLEKNNKKPSLWARFFVSQKRLSCYNEEKEG